MNGAIDDDAGGPQAFLRTALLVTSSKRWRLLIAAVLACGGCSGSSATAPGATWIAGEDEQQAVQLERHLRGFDVAMMETGYRYVELYWAGRDNNWDAAAYHVEKIRLAIENGLERRPNRTASAQTFLAGPLAAIGEAVAARDAKRFAERFEALTAGCNTCHSMEKVAFFEVRPPDHRISPLRQGRGADAED